MVGLVIVSHSDLIARGLVELGSQIAQAAVKIIPAGGTADGGIGTDATRISAAIQEADSGEGVVVLVDLGSAVMSAELALELLPQELQSRTVIADAPIVEGAIAAVVQSSIGGDLKQVVAAACEAKQYSKITR